LICRPPFTIFKLMDDFESMPLDLRAQVVWNQATFIESIVYYNQRVNLYSLKKSFVEVFYDAQKNEISRITLATDQDLKKYIANIDLNF
jgi:hypothetical protein